MGCIGSRVDVEADNGRQYHLKKILATGGFSQVFLADDLESGDQFAIKRIDCHSSREMERTRREVDCHRRFHSDECDTHILPLCGLAEESINSSTRFFLVFPLCKLGNIQEELATRKSGRDWMQESRVMLLFHQTCLAVKALHSAKPNPIAHRDIKPANFLFLRKDHLLLTDFGSCLECPIRVDDAKHSRLMVDDAAENASMACRAPELFTCEVGSLIDQSLDIWSLGCLLYALCYFCSPFDEVYEVHLKDHSRSTIPNSIQRGDSIALAVQSAKLRFEKDAPFSSQLIDLVSALVRVNPQQRPQIEQVIEVVSKWSQPAENGKMSVPICEM